MAETTTLGTICGMNVRYLLASAVAAAAGTVGAVGAYQQIADPTAEELRHAREVTRSQRATPPSPPEPVVKTRWANCPAGHTLRGEVCVHVVEKVVTVVHTPAPAPAPVVAGGSSQGSVASQPLGTPSPEEPTAFPTDDDRDDDNEDDDNEDDEDEDDEDDEDD